MQKRIRFIQTIVFIIIISLLFCSCAKKKKVRSVDDLSGAKVGVLLGTAAVGLRPEIEALGASFSSYSSNAALTADLKSGVIDCVIIDEATSGRIDRGIRIKALDDPFIDDDYSIACAKENADLTKAIDGVLIALAEDGALKDIVDGYISGGKYRYESKLDPGDAKFTLSVAVTPDSTPFAFKDDNGEWTGIDIDIAQAVCDALGAAMAIREEPDGEIITAIRSGRADFGMGRLVETAETRELVEFSRPYMTSVQVMLVRQ